MGNFRNLTVWQKSYQLALTIYQATGTFPKEEQFGITSQMRRAAASIPANIAEGSGRGGNSELRRFCQIALGSANELEFFIMLSHDLGYLESQQYATLAENILEIQRMLGSLIRRLKAEE